MLLTADVGNTHTSLALTRRGIVDEFVILTTESSARRFEAEVGALLSRLRGGEIGGGVVGSVVPRRTARVARAIRAAAGVDVMRFPEDMELDLCVKPKPASRVGADRLANALGALAMFGDREALIVVDVGTAVTVDIVTRGRVFEGGMIAPGPRLGSLALTDHTAQLPEVEFGSVKSAVGRSTRDAIAAGLWFGFRGLVQGMVGAALRQVPRARIVVAGGHGRACLAGSSFRCRFVPHLTHAGLAAAYREAQGR